MEMSRLYGNRHIDRFVVPCEALCCMRLLTNRFKHDVNLRLICSVLHTARCTCAFARRCTTPSTTIIECIPIIPALCRHAIEASGFGISKGSFRCIVMRHVPLKFDLCEQTGTGESMTCSGVRRTRDTMSSTKQAIHCFAALRSALLLLYSSPVDA